MNASPDLVPDRTTYRPDERVRLVWTGAQAAARLVISRLGEIVREQEVEPAVVLDLGTFPLGGYAARLTSENDGAELQTAFDVLASPLTRPRYGFLSEFDPGRTNAETVAAAQGLRKLHLNVVQFYDWAYKHAQLVTPQEDFLDPCGRLLSHATARLLIETCHEVGALALGYAAVYGVSPEHAAEHPEQLLYHRDGTPCTLGDLLSIGNVDLKNRWSDHILTQLVAAAAMGFDGFHLDTYGSPKIAWAHDGRPVDLAEKFPDFLDRVREALPEAALFFNNVNDYPTWATVVAPLDSTYIEVWDPNREYGHLVRLVEAARLMRPGRPVVLAAYLVPFVDGAGAASAARLALASVFAHGGHYLLCGEDNGVLADPYYPNFVRIDEPEIRLLRDYMDFVVANGDVLYAPDAHTVTHAHLSENPADDLSVQALTPVSPDPVAGKLWVIVRMSQEGMTLHLIDLTAQTETNWNRPKADAATFASAKIRVRWTGGVARFGTPEAGPGLVDLPVFRLGDHLVIDVPDFTAWAVIHLPRRRVPGVDARTQVRNPERTYAAAVRP